MFFSISFLFGFGVQIIVVGMDFSEGGEWGKVGTGGLGATPLQPTAMMGSCERKGNEICKREVLFLSHTKNVCFVSRSGKAVVTAVQT